MKEEFVPFPQKTKNMPFCIILAGTSFCDGSYKIYRPNSSCSCMEYIIDGTGTVIIDNKTYHPQAGDIYILPSGKDHLYFSDSENPWTKIWFNIDGPLLNGLLLSYNPSGKVVFESAGGLEYFERVHNIGRRNDLSPEEKHNSAAIVIHELMQFLYESSQKNNISPEAQTLKNYIDNHITENLTLKKLTELTYLSKSQVIRIFRSNFGKTPYDYMLDLKIEHAKNLLLNTNLMVKEISLMLSFCDEHYFSSLFKEKTGKTPSEFKKRL